MKPLKILFVCSAAPFGEIAGMGHRVRNNAKILSEIGEVTFVSIQRNKWSDDALSATREVYPKFKTFIPRRNPNGIRDLHSRLLNGKYLNTQGLQLTREDSNELHELVENTDITWVHTLKLANILNVYQFRNSILDVDDLSSVTHSTISKGSTKLLEKLHRKRLSLTWKNRERHIFDRFSVAGVCKHSDLERLRKPERSFVLPNTFHVPASACLFREAIPRPTKIGMIGNFEYRLNYDGIQWFINHCWPEVKREIPDAELRLVGKGSEKFTDKSKSIAGLGFVSDSDAEMREWSSMICPTRMGGGSSVKVSEALAKKMAVVSTSHGARGYDIKHKEEIMIADDAKDFSQSCVALATNPGLRTKIAERARLHYERSLSLESIKPTLENALKQAHSHRFQ